MEEEQKDKIYHKIEAGKKYRVWKTTFNDKDFYKIQVTQNNYDKTKDIFYINLQFKKGVELENQTDIIIHKAYENMRKNPADKYNPIIYLMITDFEVCEREEQIIQNAYDDFRANLDNNELGEEIDISDDFLD